MNLNPIRALAAWRGRHLVRCGSWFCGSSAITAIYLAGWPDTSSWQATCRRHEFDPPDGVTEVSMSPRELTFDEVDEWLSREENLEAQLDTQRERTARGRVLRGAR